jgi:hypothetical protein
MLCSYIGCSRNAAGKADFDFTPLKLIGLTAESNLCIEHLLILRSRMRKVFNRERCAPRQMSPLEKVRSADLLRWREPLTWLASQSWALENGNSKIVKVGSSLLAAIRKRLRERSGDAKDREVLLQAFEACQQAFGPLVSENAIAETWVGLHRALEESRRRHWDARRSAEWIEVVLFYAGLCAYCEETPWAHVEHIVPRSKGGSDTIRNVVPACAACNWAKGVKLGWMPRKRHRFMPAELTAQESETLVAVNS